MLLADDKICFGPLCNDIQNAPSGPGGNAQFTSLAGSIIGKIVHLVISGAGIAFLLYLLWGGLDWILSGGEKEKIEKARLKITHAVIGLIIVVISYTIFGLLAGDILGILHKTPTGEWSFSIPALF